MAVNDDYLILFPVQGLLDEGFEGAGDVFLLVPRGNDDADVRTGNHWKR
jgi:hypothetical protein